MTRIEYTDLMMAKLREKSWLEEALWEDQRDDSGSLQLTHTGRLIMREVQKHYQIWLPKEFVFTPKIATGLAQGLLEPYFLQSRNNRLFKKHIEFYSETYAGLLGLVDNDLERFVELLK